ncbi:hypothetical protein F5Y14DRAFT_286413 [Nemania sp. NC0429]|nr:hypothetical protein F5Y14DRAFT_286413 [Nemania sp. NC0429]
MDRLPNELLRLIMSQLDRKSIHTLCRVTKWLNPVAISLLYESVVLNIDDFAITNDPDSELKSISLPSLPSLQHTRHLSLRATVDRVICYRCPFDNDFVLEEAGMLKLDYSFYFRTPSDIPPHANNLIRSVINAIPENQLRSFSWDMEGRYREEQDLVRLTLERQTRTSEVYLSTGHEFLKSSPQPFSINLVSSKEVRSLTWRGLSSYNTFGDIRNFIHAHGKKLTTLGLHFTINNGYNPGIYEARPTVDWEKLVTDILDIQSTGTDRNVLSNLEHLALSLVWLKGATREFITSLNIERLRSLELRCCPGGFSILDELIRINRAASELGSPPNPATSLPRLKKLTIVLHRSDYDPGIKRYHDKLRMFLLLFKGLESVRLGLLNLLEWNIVALGLLNHRETLKYVVIGSEGKFESCYIPWSEEIGRLCQIPSLIGLAIGMQPWVFAGNWQQRNSRPSCKMLHIRVSGRSSNLWKPPAWLHFPAVWETSDPFIAFADWVFGVDGIPALSVLACGDFSFPSYFDKRERRVFQRHDGGYRDVTDSIGARGQSMN